MTPFYKSEKCISIRRNELFTAKYCDDRGEPLSGLSLGVLTVFEIVI